jgi:uncharacterized repeat protein (TIGR03803 family)
MKRNLHCALAGMLLMGVSLSMPVFAGSWTPLTHSAPGVISTMLLLSDGTVMGAMGSTNADGSGNQWCRLTPDFQGSYANGNWSTMAPMNNYRLYFASVVLTNGQVFVAGGEYGTDAGSAELYDPLNDAWTVIPDLGTTEFEDAISTILSSGDVLIAPVYPSPSGTTVIYRTALQMLTNGPALFRGQDQAEASWVKLPDDSILTVDPYGTNSERYIPSINQWINDTNVPVPLYDPYGSELGAGLLLPGGQAFFLGANGNTALYTPSGNTTPGTWQAGPVIPSNQGAADAPAAMMVNGKILCAVAAAPAPGVEFSSPSTFYEYDPTANSFTQISSPNGSTFYPPPYVQRMLDLPDGGVLFSDSGSQLFIYYPDGAPLAAGKPAISSISRNPDGSFHLTGLGLNGISAGAAYGDDAQMDGNYPLVRMTNAANGNVYYARTYNWSSTSVMTGSRTVASEFALPAGLPLANYSLVVVANGNCSDPVAFSNLTLVPEIVAQPNSQTNTEGTTVTFGVAAAGTPLNYFWLRDGSFVPGATNSSYLATNVQLADSGTAFSCIVSNLNGPVLSSNAVLTVISGRPVITAQPLDQQMTTNGTANFSISASGTPPFAYFWRQNQTYVAGATNRLYVTSNRPVADSGSLMDCVVTNLYGRVTSSPALLIVVPAPLHTFPGGFAQALPYGGLVQGTDGNFYGTSSGNNSFFRLTTNGTVTSWASFDYSATGSNPRGTLIQGRDGYFYGTTLIGGTNGLGTVFKITTNGIITVLAEFNNNNGSEPHAGLVLGNDGNFYGTTPAGGAFFSGIAFSITTNGTLTTLVSFPDFDSGSTPSGGLIQGQDGNFYGTTVNGGAGSLGTVFQMTTNGVVTTLLSFTGTNGANPQSALVQDSNGRLYGTTLNGGTNNLGAIFCVTTNSQFIWSVSFNGQNGASPVAGLTLGTDDVLYGGAPYGGVFGNGTLFSITTNGQFTTLFSFAGVNGANPQAALTQAADGNFYGTTPAGGAGYDGTPGSGNGTIFCLPLPSLRASPAVSAVAAANGRVQMTFTTPPTSIFRVLGSTNLLTWQTVALLTNYSGTLPFSDPDSTNFNDRFYRLAMP